MVLGTFPKAFFHGDFPSGNFPIVEFPSGNFPKVRLGPLRRCRLQWGPSVMALWLGWARGPNAGPRTCCGEDRLWKLPLGKLHFWEATPWEQSFCKVPDMFLRFEVYLIFARLGISAEGLKVQSLISFIVSSCLYPGDP